MRTDQQPVRIALFAPDGRMGKAIQAAIADDLGFELENDRGDVIVDFSAPDALRASLDRAISAGVPLVIGTTGLIEEHEALIADAARIIPILRAPNTSIGVALLAAAGAWADCSDSRRPFRPALPCRFSSSV